LHLSEYVPANWARAKPAMVNWLTLTTPIPNWDTVKIPQANWPIAITPLAGTGRLPGLYLNEICSQGNPKMVAGDLYSNPHPSH
jgi:hypothetical protein